MFFFFFPKIHNFVDDLSCACREFSFTKRDVLLSQWHRHLFSEASRSPSTSGTQITGSNVIANRVNETRVRFVMSHTFLYTSPSLFREKELMKMWKITLIVPLRSSPLDNPHAYSCSAILASRRLFVTYYVILSLGYKETHTCNHLENIFSATLIMLL